MACGTCGGKKYQFEARFKDGTQEVFPTQMAANAAIRKAGGGSVRAVPKAK